MTTGEFREWLESVGADERYPGGIGFTYIQRVPTSDLAAFEATIASDPVHPEAGVPFTLTPPGTRPYYCLERLGSVRAADTTVALVPPGLDYCSASEVAGLVRTSVSGTFRSAGETGEFTIRALDARTGLFGILAPVYRMGARPTTDAQRWNALIGWVGATFDGATLLDDGGGARLDHRVDIRHRNPGEESVLIVSAGTATGAATRAASIEADGSWEVRITGSATPQGLDGNERFWGLLLAALSLSGLLFAFVRVLTRGRGDALRMVEDKTGELRYQTLHDSLTGLPNRALILDRVTGALGRARRNGTPVAAMFLDLDGFKKVNDTYGHAVGDEVLRDVASRLTGLLRSSDTVGRLGGDEFVVLVEGDSLDAGPEVIAQRIRDVLGTPLVIDDHITIQHRASIGIALGLRETANQLLHDADIALHEAKESGKDCFVVFATEMQTTNQRRRDLELDLRRAVGSTQFFLAYQPTFDLRTGVTTGVEALIRWNHPTRGVVMPDEFVPAAEQTALIVPIGRWVLAEACRQAMAWRRSGYELGISVNVSGRQLDHDVDLVADVRAALAESGLDASLLTLELTETMLMRDTESSARTLHALKALGVRIAIDDFGTGYCSLAYLEKFPVDALKIDRSFVSGIASSTAPSVLIHTFVQLGKTLGITTLAEGIETPEQLAYLKLEECESGQGYLFARPLTPAGVEALLDDATARV